MRHNVRRMFVGRENWVKHPLDYTTVANEREPLEKPQRINRERWQGERIGESKPLIAEQVERQVKPLANLALVISGLCAEPEHLRAKLANLCVVIAESTGLRGAATRARNGVPTRRERDAGPARERVGIDDDQSRPSAEIHINARGGKETQIRKLLARKMGACAVIHWNGQVRRQSCIGAFVHSVMLQCITLCYEADKKSSRGAVNFFLRCHRSILVAASGAPFALLLPMTFFEIFRWECLFPPSNFTIAQDALF